MSYRIFDPRANPHLVTAVQRNGLRTLTDTPIELFAQASALPNRGRLVVRNLSGHTRARVGVLTANLQRDGEIVEPGEVLGLACDPAVHLPVYACSEGGALTVHVEEN